MSNHSPLSNEQIAPSSGEAEHSDARRRRLPQSLKGPVQFTSFWIAIALPFVHLPLLAQGLGDFTTTVAFFTLLTINVVALYLGHGYNQS